MVFLVILSALSLPSKLVDKCLSGKRKSHSSFHLNFNIENSFYYDH